MSEGKKSHKRLKIGIIIAAFLFALGFLVYYNSCKSVMGSKIDERNSRAISCFKAVSRYVGEVYDRNREKIPGGELVIMGTADKNGLLNEPCELLGESQLNAYFSSSSKMYWAVRFRDGEACEAWWYCEPLTRSQLRFYSIEEQRSQYEDNVFKLGENVIGYYSAEQGSRFVH